MSVPHTGRLVALVNGQRCEFNGDIWTTPDTELTRLLNDCTDMAVKHHANIHELALGVLRKAKLLPVSTIVEWRGDAWPDELPDGAID